MNDNKKVVKFLFEFAGRTDTLPFAVAIGFVVIFIWLLRRHYQYEQETQRQERRDQVFAIKILFVAAVLIVPATTFLRPANPVDLMSALPSISRKERNINLDGADALTRITWRTFAHTARVDLLDVLMGVTVVALVMVVSVMTWPMACDLCAFQVPLAAHQRDPKRVTRQKNDTQGAGHSQEKIPQERIPP